MDLITAIETYLELYRTTRLTLARRTPRAPQDSISRTAWRLTEIELGLERQGVPVGPIEGRQGPPVTLEA